VERPLVYQRVHDRNHTRNFAAWWTSYISIVNRMLKHPKLYPKDAGESHRDWLKTTFHQSERVLVRSAGAALSDSVAYSQPSNPNQP